MLKRQQQHVIALMVIAQANSQSASGWTQVGTLSSDVVTLDKPLQVDQQAPAEFPELLVANGAEAKQAIWPHASQERACS